MAAIDIGTRVIPGLGPNRRHVRGCVDVGGLAQVTAFAQCREFFCIPLFHHAEAAELALGAVEVPVMVGIARNETVAADAVEGCDPFNTVHRKWQASDPWFSVLFVGEIELGGGRVLHLGFGSQVVRGLDEQMRLLPAHQIDVAHGSAAAPGRGEDQTRQAVPLPSRSRA